MHLALYQHISPACCHIAVTVNDELVSEGSGFAFLPSGEVLTAAHVVTGRFPIQREDYQDPAQRILCKFPGQAHREYIVAICGMDIEVTGYMRKLQLDLAILTPSVPFSDRIPHLITSTHPPQLGELVFAAGYSDEVKAPFGIDLLVPGGRSALNAAAHSTHDGYLTDLGGPIIKQGVIGHLTRAVASYGNPAKELQVEQFYIDNQIHSGASGGPICNVHGQAVGLIAQRSVTSASQEQAPDLIVPSGCTIALGLQPLRALA